jgi:hypothetical protein
MRDRVRNTDIKNIIGIPPCIEYTEQQRLAILLECNMINQHPKLSIAVIQEKGQEEDQAKDGLTVS